MWSVQFYVTEARHLLPCCCSPPPKSCELSHQRRRTYSSPNHTTGGGGKTVADAAAIAMSPRTAEINSMEAGATRRSAVSSVTSFGKASEGKLHSGAAAARIGSEGVPDERKQLVGGQGGSNTLVTNPDASSVFVSVRSVGLD
jgi:hypothetical protein